MKGEKNYTLNLKKNNHVMFNLMPQKYSFYSNQANGKQDPPRYVPAGQGEMTITVNRARGTREIKTSEGASVSKKIIPLRPFLPKEISTINN
jgi:hypothetical protein